MQLPAASGATRQCAVVDQSDDRGEEFSDPYGRRQYDVDRHRITAAVGLNADPGDGHLNDRNRVGGRLVSPIFLGPKWNETAARSVH
jgi:hypothetical protein